jgi:predicted nuclease with TOPRIM domain
MMNFYKRDTLNDKFEEFEKRFQLKLDEQNITHNTQIQKLNDKIARLETENSRTYELIDKLYEYRFQEINNNTAKLSEQMSSKLNHCISVYDNKLHTVGYLQLFFNL